MNESGNQFAGAEVRAASLGGEARVQDAIEYLLGSASFVPHGYCLLWRPDLVWMHAVSDLLIALAYFSIPLALIDFVHRRRDLRFKWIFWMFAAFITACGQPIWRGW